MEEREVYFISLYYFDSACVLGEGTEASAGVDGYQCIVEDDLLTFLKNAVSLYIRFAASHQVNVSLTRCIVNSLYLFQVFPYRVQSLLFFSVLH